MTRPFLTREREHALAIRWRDQGDEKAMHEIVLAHEPLIRAIVYKFRRFGLSREDMIAEGFVGLMKAAHRFDPDRGFRFSTCAQFWIRASIQEYVLANWSVVKPSVSTRGKAEFFSGKRPVVMSIDTPVRDDSALTFGDLLKADPVDIDGAIDRDRLSARLDRMVAKLNPREREIVAQRHRSEDGATLDTIGQQFGISKERVRQIEARALRKLAQMAVA